MTKHWGFCLFVKVTDTASECLQISWLQRTENRFPSVYLSARLHRVFVCLFEVKSSPSCTFSPFSSLRVSWQILEGIPINKAVSVIHMSQYSTCRTQLSPSWAWMQQQYQVCCTKLNHCSPVRLNDDTTTFSSILLNHFISVTFKTPSSLIHFHNSL